MDDSEDENIPGRGRRAEPNPFSFFSQYSKPKPATTAPTNTSTASNTTTLGTTAPANMTNTPNDPLQSPPISRSTLNSQTALKPDPFVSIPASTSNTASKKPSSTPNPFSPPNLSTNTSTPSGGSQNPFSPSLQTNPTLPPPQTTAQPTFASNAAPSAQKPAPPKKKADPLDDLFSTPLPDIKPSANISAPAPPPPVKSAAPNVAEYQIQIDDLTEKWMAAEKRAMQAEKAIQLMKQKEKEENLKIEQTIEAVEANLLGMKTRAEKAEARVAELMKASSSGVSSAEYSAAIKRAEMAEARALNAEQALLRSIENRKGASTRIMEISNHAKSQLDLLRTGIPALVEVANLLQMTERLYENP